MVPNKSSDHEEADTKLVVLTRNASVLTGSTVMIRSLFGVIDTFVSFYICSLRLSLSL